MSFKINFNAVVLVVDLVEQQAESDIENYTLANTIISYNFKKLQNHSWYIIDKLYNRVRRNSNNKRKTHLLNLLIIITTQLLLRRLLSLLKHI